MGRPKLPRIRPDSKVCSLCGKRKAYKAFANDSRTPDMLNSRCKGCISSEKQVWRLKLKTAGKWTEYLRHRQWRVKYGLTPEDYAQMLKAQDGGCAICRKKPSYFLRVDHCHQTKIIRGLLCAPCNTAIAHLGDSAELLQRALRYLDNGSRNSRNEPARTAAILRIYKQREAKV